METLQECGRDGLAAVKPRSRSDVPKFLQDQIREADKLMKRWDNKDSYAIFRGEDPLITIRQMCLSDDDVSDDDGGGDAGAGARSNSTRSGDITPRNTGGTMMMQENPGVEGYVADGPGSVAGGITEGVAEKGTKGTDNTAGVTPAASASRQSQPQRRGEVSSDVISSHGSAPQRLAVAQQLSLGVCAKLWRAGSGVAEGKGKQGASGNGPRGGLTAGSEGCRGTPPEHFELPKTLDELRSRHEANVYLPPVGSEQESPRAFTPVGVNSAPPNTQDIVAHGGTKTAKEAEEHEGEERAG
ncbi:unnamed protein product, partial [Discosporangium mesarthrocarpum]